MKITDLLKKEGIKIGGTPVDKQDAINQMVDLMVSEGNINDKERYKAGVFAREASPSRMPRPMRSPGPAWLP